MEEVKSSFGFVLHQESLSPHQMIWQACQQLTKNIHGTTGCGCGHDETAINV